jgi:serine protease inhibitor
MRTNHSLLAALASATILTNCSPNAVNTPPPTRPLTRSEAAIVTADNTFGLDLFRQLEREKRGENVFISPLSISMALGMTLNGARGATLDSMRSTLALHGLGQEEINGSYRTLIDLLHGLDPRVTFEIANSIWYRPELAVLPAFIDANRTSFDAEVTPLDFTAPDAKDRINGWVSSKTHGRIPTIVDEIPRDAVMYLINALYFKGSWATQFDPDSTQRGEFTRLDGSKKPVDLMFRSGRFSYHENPQYQVVDLPYGFDRYSMTVILPKPGVDVNTVVNALDNGSWTSMTASLDSAAGMIFLPKMKLEWKESLNEWLKRMGMSIAFDDRADFTGIDANGGLAISDVRHKTFVEINEEGTEAAAVTSVEISRTSVPLLFTMRMDRPFIFAIREKTSGTIMFIGKVVDP